MEGSESDTRNTVHGPSPVSIADTTRRLFSHSQNCLSKHVQAANVHINCTSQILGVKSRYKVPSVHAQYMYIHAHTHGFCCS